MKVKIGQLKSNPKNPRILKDSKYKSLKKSLQEFPEMLEKRPLVVSTDIDGKFVVIGGNMRYKVAKEIGIKELSVILADDWSDKQKEEFSIKDNTNYGEWDYEILANEWNASELIDWGVPKIDWVLQDINYEPNTSPFTSSTEVTEKDIEKANKNLAQKLDIEYITKEIQCPSCGYEFKIWNS